MTLTRTRTVEMPTDSAILAYAAGLFDGEGSISIVSVSQNTGSRIKSHRLMISLANTDRTLIDWMYGNFGGCISTVTKKDDRCKQAWRWQTNSAHAGEFLTAIRPYLRGKCRQADIGLELRSTIRKSMGNVDGRNGTPKNPVTSEMYEYREALRQKMKILNKRGVDTEMESGDV